MRGNAARERKESLEPLLACFAEQLDVRPVFRTAQHRQNRDGDYVQQPMVAATDHSRIFQVPETRLQTTKEIPGRVVHDRAVPGTRPRRSRLAAGLRTAFLRNVLASRSLRPAFDAPALSSARVRRTGTQTSRHVPGNQLRHRVAAGMIHAQALGKEDPDGYSRRINPTLPKPSCRTEGFENTLFGQERSKQQRPIPSRLRDRGSKRTQHLGLLARRWTCL